jgi:RNA polymerase sigma factor (sigma-70 family)
VDPLLRQEWARSAPAGQDGVEHRLRGRAVPLSREDHEVAQQALLLGHLVQLLCLQAHRYLVLSGSCTVVPQEGGRRRGPGMTRQRHPGWTRGRKDLQSRHGSGGGPGAQPVTAARPLLPPSGPPAWTADEAEQVRVVVRRVVGSRVRDAHLAEDLVQETLTRVYASREGIDPAAVLPYAISTARNLVASTWRQEDRTARNLHRAVDLVPPDAPEDAVLDREESEAVAAALTRLSDRDRDTLLAHDVHGRATASLAGELHTSAGAVAAQLKRTRARLRVEYLLALDGSEPPTRVCRPVLLALSGGDRRRQREVDVAGHLLSCAFCAELSRPLSDRAEDSAVVRIPVATDADVVAARKAGRELAAEIGFGPTDGTLIATAISEVTRNIVKFAGTGEVRLTRVEEPTRTGVQVVARDAGPGIADPELAMTDGHSTYGGLGLGLPGCRRLMDDFALESAAGEGTTVTMCKWRRTDRGAAG